MNLEERQEAIFGAFDGVVSMTGFIFGLLLQHASPHLIAAGGVGGAIAAGISMGTGEVEKGDSPWKSRVKVGLTMFCASLVGSLMPVWPFFVWGTSTALLIAGTGCLFVATWIGYEKRRGIGGYASAYITLCAAAGLTLLVSSLIPNAG